MHSARGTLSCTACIRHMFLLVAVAVVGAIHGAGIILIGFGLYGLDFLFRYLYVVAAAYPMLRRPCTVTMVLPVLGCRVRASYLAAHRNAHEVELTRLPANVVRVKFARVGVAGLPVARTVAVLLVWAMLQNKMRYYGGQYVFINIPSISLFQWHPFSLSSAPFEQDCMLHVRVLGNWTQALCVVRESASLPWSLCLYPHFHWLGDACVCVRANSVLQV